MRRILMLMPNVRQMQYHCGKGIEKHAGALRTGLIYFISGIGGYELRNSAHQVTCVILKIILRIWPVDRLAFDYYLVCLLILNRYAVSGIFAPTTVSVGADPAAFGLLGVQLVELFQAWQIVPDRRMALTKVLLL